LDYRCFVEYNACYVLHFVAAIILRHTQNIYETCNYCKPHRLKANFIQIDQHLKKLLQKYKGVPILWITVYRFGCSTTAANYGFSLAWMGV